MTEADEPWKDDIIEQNDLICVLFNKSKLSFWPTFALAAALIDRDVISKNDLLHIVEGLISYVSALSVRYAADHDERVQQLTDFRDALERHELRPGSVQALVRELEAEAFVILERWRSGEPKDEP